jgi:uncharacterized membrane protein YdfJ with MMPL/SSD domain
MRTRIIQDNPDPPEAHSKPEAPRSHNLAARMGRWSARHRRKAIVGWIVFVVLAYMVGGKVGTDTLSESESGVGDSGAAAKLIDERYPDENGEAVILQSKTAQTDDPQFREAVDDVLHGLEGMRGVANVESPYEHPDDGISDDGHSALVTFELTGDPQSTKTKDNADATVAATERVQEAHPDLVVEQFGSVSSEQAFMDVFEKDLKKAAIGSLPITLVLLTLTFGALVAAGIPLLLGITAVLATLGLVGPLSQLSPVEDTINHVVLLIGLAVGVDYALFYLRRMREERAAGKDSDAALEAAAATSGRAVLVSGVTVMIAMAGMYFAGAATFTSFATGTILVVAIAMIGSLTVLPAILSKVGDRTERSRIPGLGRIKRRVAAYGFWSRVVDRVLRRPKLSAALASAVLLALAVPAIGLDTGTPNVDASLPQDEPVVQTYNRVTEAFPAETQTLEVVVKAEDVTAPAVTAGIDALEEESAEERGLFPGGAVETDVSPDRTVNRVSIEITGNGADEESNEALDALRNDIVPATIGSVVGVEALVNGQTAIDRDFNDTMKSHLPYVFAFVLSAAFLVLLVTFRSIVVPLKAIVLNLMSVAASYGVMVLVFQHGLGKSLLGFSETGPITAWIPLFMFVILFGLSMDYHVFILSRVREAYDKGMSTEDAVSYAIKKTAGVVTSAALVMVGVFSIFGTLSYIELKQMGVGSRSPSCSTPRSFAACCCRPR